MNERTDLGWFTFGIDQPLSNLTNINFSNGIFSATGTTSSPNFWLLDTGLPDTAPVTKTGLKYPIDSTRYRRLMMRLNLSAGGIGQLVWSNHTIYNGVNSSNGFYSYPGWFIYSIDMPSLGVAAGIPWASQPVDSLRVQPVNVNNVNLSLDWVRLVAYDTSVDRMITWTGSGAVDLFLDNDRNPANGFIAQIAAGVTGNVFEFYAGGLPLGTYYVAIRPSGSTGTPAYSAGAYVVDDIPTLKFTAPSPEGSADDFATVQLGNPWDMHSLSDIDETVNVTGNAITSISAEDEAGHALGNLTVFQGASAPALPGGWGDPDVWPLYWTVRGQYYHIDTSRYRILTLNQSVTGARDYANGSMARIEWRIAGDQYENVSAGIVLDQFAGVNVMQKVILDMKALPLEATPGGSPSTTGWNGMADGFRIHPHEFASPRTFYIGDVKLAALEKADTSYTIQWNYTYAGTAQPLLGLYYSAAPGTFNGTAIATGLNPASGSETWTVAGVQAGTYYLYAQLTVGSQVVNQTYAPWPIVIDHTYAPLPQICVSQPLVAFTGTNQGAVMTGSQDVYVTVSSKPQSVSWSVNSNIAFLQASPTSGIGNGKFAVQVNTNGVLLPSPAGYDGAITLTATGVDNSPQFVRVPITVIDPATAQPPFGNIDTPADGATGVAGGLNVSGWALDDIGVQKVDIWRESATGFVYIGDAVFSDNARPDVQALYPLLPLSSRAGWGLQILTNMLPGGGGSFRLHALAHDLAGHVTDLGARAITVDNAHSVQPFGTIDTPAPGATISGAYVNFGWVVTPQPNIIAVDGSTITVWIDNTLVGHPVYNNLRSDIASLFPGLRNSNGAVGYYMIDTTKLANGEHSISWTAIDSAGNSNGIGSRYFNVQN